MKLYFKCLIKYLANMEEEVEKEEEENEEHFYYFNLNEISKYNMVKQNNIYLNIIPLLLINIITVTFS